MRLTSRPGRPVGPPAAAGRAPAQAVCAPLVALALAACAVPPAGPERASPPPGPFAYDPVVDPGTRVRERSHGDGFTRLRIDFASPVAGRAPAILLVPAGEGPFPALLMMHGLPGSPASMTRLAEAYARIGVASLSLSAPWNREDLPYRDGARFIPAPLFDRHDREELVQIVLDLRRGVDVLRSRPAIAGDAIGFVGHSYGATAGALLAAVEPRLAGFALMAPSNGLVTIATTGFRGLQAAAYADLAPDRREAWVRSLLDLEADRWIGRAPPGRGLIQAGRRDAQVRPEDTITLSHAAPGVALRWYDAGHALSARAFREQAEFLAPLLGFDATGFAPPDSIY